MIASPRSGRLVEFSFESEVASDLSEVALMRLARQAWRHNTGAGLTGEMRVSGARVRQVIEGDVDAVLPLASRILADPRHGRIRVLAFGPLERRRFRGWAVAGIEAASAAAAAPDGLAPVVAFRRPDPSHGRAARCAIAARR